MIRRPPRSTLSSSSAASDVYKRQGVEPSVTTGVEPSVTTGVEPSVTTGVEPSVTTGVEPSSTTGVEPSVTTGIEPSSIPGIEPSIGIVEPSITIGVEPSNVIGSADSSAESPLDGIGPSPVGTATVVSMAGSIVVPAVGARVPPRVLLRPISVPVVIGATVSPRATLESEDATEGATASPRAALGSV